MDFLKVVAGDEDVFSGVLKNELLINICDSGVINPTQGYYVKETHHSPKAIQTLNRMYVQ